MRYKALVFREGSSWLAEFPDCPGCQTFADSEEELSGMAKDALEGWLEAHLVDGQAPPRPSRNHGAAPRGRTVMEVPVSPRLAVALRIRWERQRARLTQGELALRAGVTQQQIAKLEHPDENPSIGTLAKVADALGLELEVSFRRVA
jgi:predicted RNase H-like HicB family nuclease/DNA-binding XRE family transcriptional regulator